MYKARLVARGFTHVPGLDYTGTYAPVARMASVRTILALAARKDWEVDAFNFNSAYLNGELNEDDRCIWRSPPAMRHQGKT